MHERRRLEPTSYRDGVSRLFIDPFIRMGESVVSLTETEHLFAGLHETGANDLFHAFFTARPKHLNYRTSPTVGSIPPSAAAWTTVPTIAFPGIPGGIQYAVQFSLPVIDFDPNTLGVPPPLVFAPGEFSVRTSVTLTLLCGRRRDQDDPDHRGPIFTLQRATLGVVGLGRVKAQTFAPGVGEISFELQAVEIVDIKPDDLESLVECLVLALLGAVLTTVRLPFSGIPVAGAFTLLLLRGPETEDDQVKLYGDAV